MLFIFLTEFNSSRGHNIERGNYLEELRKFETKPLKFETGSYEKLMEVQLQGRMKQIKPLMDVPPPLLSHFRIPPENHRFIPSGYNIQPLMGLPPPLIPPRFQHIPDPRSLNRLNVRPSSSRPRYVGSSHGESKGVNRRYRNHNKRSR